MNMLNNHQTSTSLIVDEEQERLQARIEMKKRALVKRLSVLGGLALLCAVFFAISLYNQNVKISAKVEQKGELKAQLSQLEKEEKELKVEINKLSNSDEYLAQIARQKHLYSKPGETLYSISK
jgi:cell division protein DivIC